MRGGGDDDDDDAANDSKDVGESVEEADDADACGGCRVWRHNVCDDSTSLRKRA